MYLLIVVMTMFILPVASVLLEGLQSSNFDLLLVAGKWIVFWAVGVRLFLAGLRQYLQPGFTSREIMGIESQDVFVLVRELGGANIAAGAVGLMSIVLPTFVLPSALASGIFYAFAAAEHAKSKNRSTNKTIALISDALIAIVLVGFAVGALARVAPANWR